MNTELKIRIEDLLGTEILRAKKLSGGDAAQAWRLDFNDDRSAFLKTVPDGNPFRIEALGLQRLSCPGGMRIPKVLAVDDDFLLLEWIDFGYADAETQGRMGEALARTHLQCRGEKYGFDADHSIGVTPQKNVPMVDPHPGSWAEFWWSHRLEPMFQRLGEAPLMQKGLKLSDQLDQLLPDPSGPPSLLHGDLWSGNVGVDQMGQPTMFDPAPYYGHPEADLGMTRMFGGFDRDFYEGYTRNFSVLKDYSERLDLYMLYHVLNHICIFGSGYVRQAVNILNRYI